MARYLMRFDDINSRMDWNRFFIIKKVLEKYNIRSILGVVPNCQDKTLEVGRKNPNFFENLRKFSLYGDVIAQHGYDHVYDSKSSGFFGNTLNSEFSGHSYQKQINKLSKGKAILEKESLWRPIFMAPNHSFDSVTIEALKELNFTTVLDGLALFPFKANNLDFISQISSRPLPVWLPCLSQLCVHINTISEKELNQLIYFIEKNHKYFTNLEDLKVKNNIFTLFERKFISILIRTFRLLKRLNSLGSIIFFKSRCLFQRSIYFIKFRNIEIYKWHLLGTFFCRTYKIESLKIINYLRPDIYIDIGCGLGEILTKVKIPPEKKWGYDIDLNLIKVHKIFNKKNFTFFSDEKDLLSYAKNLRIEKDNCVVVSMLNFSHILSKVDLENIINKYFNAIGKYTLLIDNIYVDSKEYKYNHHEFLYNHNGLIKYIHKVDQLRSLYCLEIG